VDQGDSHLNDLAHKMPEWHFFLDLCLQACFIFVIPFNGYAGGANDLSRVSW